MVELHDNFLNILKLFLALVSHFMRMGGGGKERKMNGRLATANQVRDGGNSLKKSLRK
jgi:hypothetical protein